MRLLCFDVASLELDALSVRVQAQAAMHAPPRQELNRPEMIVEVFAAARAATHRRAPSCDDNARKPDSGKQRKEWMRQQRQHRGHRHSPEQE